MNARRIRLCLASIYLATVLLANAQVLVEESGALNLPVPDGDPVGVSHALVVNPSTPGTHVGRLILKLRVRGDFVGDVYAQLTHEGEQAVLLNRPGRTGANLFGYDDVDLDLRLDDAATAGDVHTYRVALNGNAVTPPPDGVLAGTWSPDGRNVSPLEVTDASARTAMLGAFTGTGVDGEWRLLVADLDAGSTHTLVSWGLEITPAETSVPEPEEWSRLAGLACAGWIWCRWHARGCRDRRQTPL